MKASKLLILSVLMIIAVSCKDGYIDEITKVAPGADETAPQITMKFPAEGTKIKVGELITTIGIDFEVSDDIEVTTIVVKVDGNDAGTITEFLDYRKVVVDDLMYPGVANGEHTLEIAATDVDGKTTTKSATFTKEPPYTPIYDGEIFYMSFNADVRFKELVTYSDPTIMGDPTLADEGAMGGSSYKGAEAAYLTYPTTALKNNELSAIFWMKVNSTPDRAGILVTSPPDTENPTAPNNHTSGFRFFREDAGGKQRFKLNLGDGTNEHWFDGSSAADVVPNTDEWTNFAFTIAGDKATVYINGNVVSTGAFPGISWTDCDILSIMSGEPNFTGWSHFSDQSLLDELRIFNKALTQEEVQTIINDKYEPYDGEVFYLPFEGDYNEFLTGTPATVVGDPDFTAEGKKGEAYAGAADSYLTFPTTGLQGTTFSATFWLKIDATPDRAGILVMGPPDPDLPDTPNNRKSGFRFFREDASGKQRFKLNVGDGEADTWFDGGAAADVDPADGEWVFFAFTIAADKATVYINGTVVSTAAFSGVDWTDCDILSIMSGDPRFEEWGHHSDESFMDELRIFDKALSQAEITAIMNN